MQNIKTLAAKLLLIIVLLSACKPKQEKIVKEKYADGSPRLIEYVSKEGNAQKSFVQNSFYQGNKKQSEGEIRNGKMEGKWTYYYDNGKKWSEGYFRNGIEQGMRTVYFENGKKRYEGLFKDGNKTGTWKFYDESGKLVREVKY